MAKNAVTDWDAIAANNAEIAGINIAEGCPAGGINDAIRTVMAQVAGWLASASGPLLKSGGTMGGAIVAMGNASSIIDAGGTARAVGYRNIPLTAKSAVYTLSLGDVGQGITTASGLTVPANATAAFANGDTIALYNNSAATVTITPASGVTLRLAGSATTGPRSLAARGLASLIKVGVDEWVISGMGVS